MLIPLWNLHTGHQCLGENPTRLYRRHRGVESVPVAFFVRRRRAGRVSLKGMFFSLSWWITFSTGSRRSASRSFPTQKLKCFYHHIQAHMRLVIVSGVLTWRKFSLNEDVLPSFKGCRTITAFSWTIILSYKSDTMLHCRGYPTENTPCKRSTKPYNTNLRSEKEYG